MSTPEESYPLAMESYRRRKARQQASVFQPETEPEFDEDGEEIEEPVDEKPREVDRSPTSYVPEEPEPDPDE